MSVCHLYNQPNNFKVLKYQQNNMLNFNNKKEKRQPSQPPLVHSLSVNQQNFGNQLIQQKQHTPTQCLLLLSDLQQRNDYMRRYTQEKQVEEVEVTPWINNVPYRINKQKMRSKSKTSTLMSSCNDDTYINLTSSSHKTTERKSKQKISLNTKKQSHKQLKLIDRNSESIKNIHSAIARYNQPSENMGFVSHDFQNRKIETNPNLTYMKSHQYRKIYESCMKNKSHNLTSKSKNRNRRQNNENNNVLEVADFSGGRFQEKLKIFDSAVTKNKEHKNSVTDSVLRQNTAIVNEAYRLNSCEGKSQQNEISTIKNVREFSEITSSIQNISMFKEHNSREQTIFRKAQFQNILTDAQKKTSEYHRIKHKIIQSIKKQSIIRQSQQFDINKSKKMLGRYFKQIQQKNPKTKNKLNLSNLANPNFNMNISNNGDMASFDNNPLTKHLHDKYKLLLSKGK